MLDAFSQNLIVESIRVYPPKRFVLLCGGEVGSIVEQHPRSLRDAFLRGGGLDALRNTEILQIEEIQEFFEKDSPYVDLVEFETDIAKVCELVVLFSESPGSFTELGSFSMVRELYEKIIVIIQSQHLSKSNFITKGPIANFKREYDNSVFSIVDGGIGIINGDISKVDCNRLVNNIANPLRNRLIETESKTTFDHKSFNHLCKIYVAVLREFYCLKDDEILLLLWEIGFRTDFLDKPTLDKVAFCCMALKWTKSTTVGFDKIHYAIQANNEAAKFELTPPLSDRLRRRAEFRAHWTKVDPDRIAAVDQELQQ